MKANSYEAAQQKAWENIRGIMRDNIAMMLLVLHNEYGFGRERIKTLLDKMTDMAERFDEYDNDGVLDIKRDELTGGFINPKDLHEFLKIRLKDVIPEEYHDELFGNKSAAFHEVRAQSKSKARERRKRQAVDVATAAEIQQKILAMKNFQTKGPVLNGK
ncbi:MAG: hypothetical protein NC253_15625 [Ruminococcus sp.]|nr:hypothetical protein [Ruminococcus sp.]MCM1380590.1 hypothetical protein [Muribaculaceae bacterium]MCM1479773.1 hypothetical protein [Muribaculaceae bacterium]